MLSVDLSIKLQLKSTLIMPLSSVITISQVESSVNVAENDGSTQLCVNITHGNVESTASFFYSTNSGTATGIYVVYIYPSPPLSNSFVLAHSNRSNSIRKFIACMHAQLLANA